MNEFKPSKGKALLKASAQVAYEESGKILEPLANAHPQMAAPLLLLRASFGVLIAYKQEKLNQFTEFLMSNQDVFTNDKLASPEFQDGLVVFISSYFKQRTEEKLQLAQRIFYDFAQSEEMLLYPLERYDDTLEKISQSGIRLLGLIHEKIPDVRMAYVESQMYEHGNTTDEISKEQWVQTYGNKPLSFFIEGYIKQQAAIRLKEYSGSEPLTEENKIKDKLRNEISIGIGELEQLGLASMGYTEGGWGPGEHYYNLNDYGKKFTSIIAPSTNQTTG